MMIHRTSPNLQRHLITLPILLGIALSACVEIGEEEISDRETTATKWQDWPIVPETVASRWVKISSELLEDLCTTATPSCADPLAGATISATYQNHLVQIVEFLEENKVVPILVTKADNQESSRDADWSINQAIAAVAKMYQAPLWNLWAAVQDLPDHGLSNDGFHLTYGQNHFDRQPANSSGMAQRNLTALVALAKVKELLDAGSLSGNSTGNTKGSKGSTRR